MARLRTQPRGEQRGWATQLCFASPSHEQIREGVAKLAEICRNEFGVPARIANVEKRARL